MKRLSLIAALLAALAVAGCGSDDSDDGGGDSAQASPSTTVSVASVDDVGDVLVDADGAALYTADQEADGKVRCTDSCAAIWIPLTISGQGDPTGSDDVSGKLGTTKRPDGERQVTLDGKPLYRFADDMSGEVTGDGLADDFDGMSFSWQVVTTDGGSSEPDDSDSGSDSRDGYY